MTKYSLFLSSFNIINNIHVTDSVLLLLTCGKSHFGDFDSVTTLIRFHYFPNSVGNSWKHVRLCIFFYGRAALCHIQSPSVTSHSTSGYITPSHLYRNKAEQWHESAMNDVMSGANTVAVVLLCFILKFTPCHCFKESGRTKQKCPKLFMLNFV